VSGSWRFAVGNIIGRLALRGCAYDALHLKQWRGTKRVNFYNSNIYDLLLIVLSSREQGLLGREAEADAPNFGDFIYYNSKLKPQNLLFEVYYLPEAVFLMFISILLLLVLC
jgi:hypothetical protein